MAVFAVQSVDVFLSRHGHLFDILTELDFRGMVNLNKFVDTAEGRLSLACDEMSSYTEAVNAVTLLVQRPNCFFVDVVGGDNGQVTEPRLVKSILIKEETQN